MKLVAWVTSLFITKEQDDAESITNVPPVPLPPEEPEQEREFPDSIKAVNDKVLILFAGHYKVSYTDEHGDRKGKQGPIFSYKSSKSSKLIRNRVVEYKINRDVIDRIYSKGTRNFKNFDIVILNDDWDDDLFFFDPDIDTHKLHYWSSKYKIWKENLSIRKKHIESFLAQNPQYKHVFVQEIHHNAHFDSRTNGFQWFEHGLRNYNRDFATYCQEVIESNDFLQHKINVRNNGFGLDTWIYPNYGFKVLRQLNDIQQNFNLKSFRCGLGELAYMTNKFDAIIMMAEKQKYCGNIAECLLLATEKYFKIHT